MDDQLEEIESAIDALIMHWEHWLVTGEDDTCLETGKMSKWHQGHPLDLNDEYLHEDPSYDDVEVEKEALRDYQAEQREVCALSDVEPTGKPKQDMDSLACGSCVKDASREQPVSKYLARLPCGKWVPLKKLSVSLQRLHIPSQEIQVGLGNTPDTDTPSEGKEAAMLLSWKLRSQSALRNEQNQKGQSIDRSKRLRQYKITQYLGGSDALIDCPKVAGGHSQTSSESSSTMESHSLKRYPFRQRCKTIRYTSGSGEDGEGREENAWQCLEDSSEEERSSEEEGARPSASVRNLCRKETLREASRHYTCPKCGKEFNNSSNMWKHLRIHNGEKPYACQECNKSYSDPSNLAKHQLAHTGERRHRCSLCPKAYYLKHQLDAHFRYHKGIRAFPCLECESSFFSRVELLRHMNIHILGKGGHPPKSVVCCEDCGKTYASRKCLQRHRRRHQRFECEICGKYFNLKYKYKFHKSCHSGPCKRCGVVGLHLCESQHLKAPVTQDVSSVSGVKGQLPSTSRGPPKTSGSDKATAKLPCPKTSSVLTRHLVPVNGREVLPNPVGSASPKESSDPAKCPSNSSSSGKLMVRLLCPKKSSVLTCPLAPINGRKGLPNPVGSASPKEYSNPIPGLSEPSQEPKSSPLIVPMLPADKTAKPDLVVVRANPPAQQALENVPLQCPETLPHLEPLQTDQVIATKPQDPSTVQKGPLPAPTSFLVPAQVVGGPGVAPTDGAVLNQMVLMVIANSGPLPAGGSVWNMPILHTVNPNQPSVKAPKEQWGVVSQQAQLLPGAASPVQSVPPRAPVLVANSNPGPSALRISVNDPLSAPSSSNPAEDLIVINPATLPPGTKITLEIPPRKIVPSILPFQTCHLCGVKYLGEHHCKMPLSEPVRRGEQETSQSGLQGKKNNIISQQLLEVAQQPRSLVHLTSQDGQEPSSIQSCNFQEACSEIIYIDDGEEGSHGVNKGPSSTKTYDFKEGQSDMIYIDGKEGSHGVDTGPSSNKTYDLRKVRSEVIYIDGEEGSDVERDTDSDWPVEDEEASESEEDEILVVTKGKKHHQCSSSGERGPAKRRKGRYFCHLCNKQFVYMRSLKQHLHLHRAFSCDQCNASYVRSEQLKWHRKTHAIQ